MVETEGFLEVLGSKIWYKKVGDGGDKLPLVVVHGGPGMSHDYLETLGELSNERQVIFYDLHDCGNSEKKNDPARWTIDSFADEFYHVIMGLGVRKFHVFAHSSGAAIAAAYLVNNRIDGLSGLVLANPLLSVPMFAKDLKIRLSELPKPVQEILRNDSPPEKVNEALMTFYKHFFCRIEPWPDCLLRSYGKMNLRLFAHLLGSTFLHFDGNMKDFDITDRLFSIKVPVLFLTGHYDETRPESVRYFYERIPSSELKVFDKSSHCPHLEQKDECIAYVSQFLKRYDII